MQAWTMQPEIQQEGWTRFWAATFENLQSEWAQLVIQGALLLGAKHYLFKADAEDMERLEKKVDQVLADLTKRPSA